MKRKTAVVCCCQEVLAWGCKTCYRFSCCKRSNDTDLTVGLNPIAYLGKHCSHVLDMRQGNQLIPRGWNGDRSVPKDAVQKPLLAVFGSVRSIYV